MAEKTFPKLFKGKRSWTPASAVEHTNLRAQGWAPAKAGKAEAPKTETSKSDAPKSSK